MMPSDRDRDSRLGAEGVTDRTFGSRMEEELPQNLEAERSDLSGLLNRVVMLRDRLELGVLEVGELLSAMTSVLAKAERWDK